jgi:type I restriction enzyme S subunit
VRAGVNRLPDGWEVVELQALVDPERPITYGVVKPGDASVNGVRLIRGGDVHHGRIRRRLRTIDEKTSRQYRRTLLRGGEIVVSLVGFPGQSAIVPRQLAGANLARQVGLVAITDFELARYVHQYIQSDLGQLILLHPLAGSAQQVVNLADLRTLPVLLPPSDLRGHIADVGEALDRAVRLLGRLIGAKGRLRDGLAQALLTGRRRLPAFAGREWRETRLGELFDERSERGQAELPLLSITADRGIIPRTDITRKDTSASDKTAYKRIAPGDIGYNTMRMWQGVSALSAIEGIVSPAYTICVPRQGIEGRYAAHLFKSPPMVHKFLRYSQGLVDDTLSLKYPQFSEIQAAVPSSSDEQSAIADILDAATREIDALTRLREAVAKQKRGLMQQLLTGRLRVPEVDDE